MKAPRSNGRLAPTEERSNDHPLELSYTCFANAAPAVMAVMASPYGLSIMGSFGLKHAWVVSRRLSWLLETRILR